MVCLVRLFVLSGDHGLCVWARFLFGLLVPGEAKEEGSPRMCRVFLFLACLVHSHTTPATVFGLGGGNMLGMHMRQREVDESKVTTRSHFVAGGMKEL